MVILVATGARADRQVIAPGTGPQDAVVVDSGNNGICETTARGDDFQATPVGRGAPFQGEIQCGPDKIANTAAAGDDTQLIPVGTACDNGGQSIIDTGPDGIANTAALGDDRQAVPVGTAAPHAPCVETGPNGVADTDLFGGDDVRLLVKGASVPNRPVIRCGPNKIAETAANNFRAGDDIQKIGVGASCGSASDIVVDSGADGIATTRAQGTDLVMLLSNPRPLKLTIRRRRSSASASVKLAVFNNEFGASAPPGRAYALSVSDGSCPRGTVSQVDADARIPGAQATAIVPLHGHVKGTFVVTLGLADVTTVDRRIPFRCTVNVEADSLDSPPGSADDAVNPANNAARVDLYAVDLNDL